MSGVPSIQVLTERTTQGTQNSVLLLNGLCRLMYRTWMESTYDKHNKNPLNQIRWGFRCNADS